jgi:hypothetical protein
MLRALTPGQLSSGNRGKIKMTMSKFGALVLPACLCLLSGTTAGAQDKPAEVFVYTTYHYCDFSKQDRADEIYAQSQKPVNEALVKDGSISSYGWLAHKTGGKWRRADYYTAGSVQALLDAQEKMGNQADPKNKKIDAEFGSICSSHDDYIWRRVAGNIGTVNRGGAAFSTYYVCDQNRETEADALVTQVFGPVYDKMVSDGKLKSWGWNEHIVGGSYRRLATFSGADMKSLKEARAAIVNAIDDNELGSTFTDICGDHTDYMWEIKFQAP